MNRRMQTIVCIALLALAGCAWPRRARAQFIGYTSPQTVQQKVFSAQTTAATTPVATTGCTPTNGNPCGIPNLGQTVHFLTYTVAGGANPAIQVRLEGSFDGVNWIPISDDATGTINGEVVAVGYYPAIRANLVTCLGCGGAVTVTASYSGVSSSPSNAYGFYNAAQQIRKVVLAGQSSAADATIKGTACPFGSLNGFVRVATSAAAFAGATVTLTARNGMTTADPPLTLTIPAAASYASFNIQNSACLTVDVTYNHGATGAGAVYLDYFFYPPGSFPGPGAQPQNIVNQESTSGANAAVSQTINATNNYHAYLYSVNARCSAGNAQITVSDNGTQVWSTGVTEVGVNTFRYQWTPPLGSAAAATNMIVTLSTCGAGNTGTLDVQASVF